MLNALDRNCAQAGLVLISRFTSKRAFAFFCRIFGHFDCCELVKSRVENSWSGFGIQKVIRMPSGQRVYIGNIPSDSRERDIERFFKGYGRIREIVIKNGYGFVEFDDYR